MAAYSTYSDPELTAFLRNDDQLAFAEIYNRYWKKMLLVAWNHTNDKAHAEDVVHEVFLTLWEKRKELEILSIPAFLTTCVKFSIFKYHKREQNRMHLVKQHYEFNETTPGEQELDALFLKEYINGIVEQLPEKCRLTFVYSRFEGLNNFEIAEKMNISEKGVEANLTRALKVIRKNVKNSGLLVLISNTVWKGLF